MLYVIGRIFWHRNNSQKRYREVKDEDRKI